MYVYDAKVRNSGSVMNEVRRRNMSAAEIMILRKVHGSDAVHDIVEKEVKTAPHADEREYLKQRYVGQSERRSRVNFEQMFGPDHMPLPARLAEFEKRKVPNSVALGLKGNNTVDQIAG